MQGYLHGKTATPHPFCILISGMPFTLNCNSSCRTEAHPSAQSLFFCSTAAWGMPCCKRDSPALGDTYPLLTLALGKIKLAGRRYGYVLPKVWQSIHFLLSEQKTKRLRLDLGHVFAGNAPYPSPGRARLDLGRGCRQESRTSQSCTSSSKFSWLKTTSAGSQHGKAVFAQAEGELVTAFPYCCSHARPVRPQRFLFWKPGCLQSLLSVIS